MTWAGAPSETRLVPIAVRDQSMIDCKALQLIVFDALADAEDRRPRLLDRVEDASKVASVVVAGVPDRQHKDVPAHPSCLVAERHLFGVGATRVRGCASPASDVCEPPAGRQACLQGRCWSVSLGRRVLVNE